MMIIIFVHLLSHIYLLLCHCNAAWYVFIIIYRLQGQFTAKHGKRCKVGAQSNFETAAAVYEQIKLRNPVETPVSMDKN